MDYSEIFSNDRIKKSSIDRPEKIDDFYSDRSRIIYCSSFRRLQQKAQLFSLEPNSNVRTRLTHSIEVSDLGRTLANKIGYELERQRLIKKEDIPMMVAIVENSCLLHDIGNPPFGHFGETAIKKWAVDALKLYADKPGIDKELIQKLYKDFIQFDGNPQGFRIISKLHCERDEFSLNLTTSTLLAGLKYVRTSCEETDNTKKDITQKAGYFQTEKKFVEHLWKISKRQPHTRYPLTYIMEVADDIAYCLSDISDGIEKNIINPNDFLSEIHSTWEKEYPKDTCPVDIKTNIGREDFSVNVSVNWSRKLIDYATESFLKSPDSFFKGTAGCLIDNNSAYGRFLDVIKKVSKKLLYKSDAAENIELAGYAVISGLLNEFQTLLGLSTEEFSNLVIEDTTTDNLALRLFHRLSPRHIKRYKIDIDKLSTNDPLYATYELWLRTHLIVDYVSGMTDSFALTTYQMLRGIKVDIH